MRLALALLLAVGGCGSDPVDPAPPVRVQVEIGDAPTLGPADAPVTFVEFADYECPFCGDAKDDVDRVLRDYGDRVRFVYKQFPLAYHAHAHLASQAALAAHAQGQFWAYHDTLYAHQSALGRTALESYASTLGLDLAAFRLALDERTHAAAVDADIAHGQAAGVRGTPTFFVNGRPIVGAVPYADLAEVIEEELRPDAGP